MDGMRRQILSNTWLQVNRLEFLSAPFQFTKCSLYSACHFSGISPDIRSDPNILSPHSVGSLLIVRLSLLREGKLSSSIRIFPFLLFISQDERRENASRESLRESRMQEDGVQALSTGILVRIRSSSFEIPPPGGPCVSDLSDAFFRPSSHNLATFALSLWPEPVDGRRKLL